MTRRLASIKLEMDAPWIVPLYNFVEGLQPGGALLRNIMRRVLVLGVLKSIRKVYLARLSTSLHTSVRGATKKERVKEVQAAGKTVNAVSAAYNRLDAAVLAGNSEGVQKARARLGRLTADAVDRDPSTGSGRPSSRTSLSSLTSAMMRQRAFQVLDYLTNTEFIADGMINGEYVVGSGRRSELDSVKTPSATQTLTQVLSGSKYDILWRHLEFGSGMYASKAKVPGQNVENPGTWWWYGRTDELKKGGLLVRGSSPMHALWGESGVPLESHSAEAQRVLNAIMLEYAPRAM